MDRRRRQISGIKSLLRGLDGLLEVLLLAVAYYFIWRHGYEAEPFPAYFGFGKYLLAGVYALLVVVLFSALDGFKFGYLKAFDALISQWVSLVLANFITYWQLCLIANKIITPTPMLILTLVGAAICFVCVLLFTWMYHQIYIPKNMAMIFGRDKAISLKFKMETRPDKYAIKKLIPVEDGFESICQQIVNYDAVIINDVPAQIRNDILKFCYQRHIRTYVTPKISDIIIRGGTSITLFDTPLLLVKGNGLTPAQQLFKRLLDLAICLPALVVALPFMVLVAIAIKAEDGGPIFYKQARASLGGKVFDILKFRSMVVDAEKYGAIPATDKDPRITKVGNFIRATRLDELPQILNIIKGDMSIVGPRPERVEHMEKYGAEIPEFAFRTKVKGGLTGFAQIYGKYNTSPYDKLRLDMMYIENYSFIMDIKLILMTARIMLKKDSTEGFDKAEELNKMTQEALAEMHESAEDNLAGVGK
ncbi:MAG: sugar transferase [Oscillospiraceae bacterium]|nr:sugar transferase [Oscillospiraceae bacterium]